MGSSAMGEVNTGGVTAS